MVPEVVRLTSSGVCGCGQVVAAGERAGSTRQPGRVVCLACVAAISADAEQLTPDAVEVPDPVAVLIPADWAPPPQNTLPGWQQSAGVPVALPPAAAVTSPQLTPPTSAIAVQVALSAPSAPTQEPTPVTEATPRHTPAVVGPAVVAPAAPPAAAPPTAAPEVSTPSPAQPVPVAAEAVAVAAEAVAMTVPSHRRRTILPPGLLALRPSRGRQPGSTGQSDPTTRAVLDSAAPGGVLALHDRRMPGRRSRIAHLAFGAGGIYVIDVVRANNARVEVLPGDDLDSHPRDLLVGGRPMTDTVAATLGRVAIIRDLLDEVGLSNVPVVGVMYFVDATVPSDTALQVAGVHVVGRAGLPTLVDSAGALDVEHRETLHEYLTERLPA
jgi:hypothetical protein